MGGTMSVKVQNAARASLVKPGILHRVGDESQAFVFLLALLVNDIAALHPSYCSAVIASTISRSRGPSNSTRTTRCHVPSSILPRSTGKATDVPISEDKI